MALFLSSARASLAHTYFLVTLCLATITAASDVSAVLPLLSTTYGANFDVNVTFGEQSFWLTVDTGSADTWAIGTGWRCEETLENGTVVDLGQTACDPPKSGPYDYKNPKNGFEIIEGQWIGDHYGAGNIFGIVGYQDLKLGSIELNRQQIGVVNISEYVYDKRAIGLLALGYPAITLMHPNNFSLEDTLHDKESIVDLFEHRIEYPTVFKRLMQEGMDGYVALALERTPRDEEFGFGSYLRFSQQTRHKLTLHVCIRWISRSRNSASSSAWPLCKHTSRDNQKYSSKTHKRQETNIRVDNLCAIGLPQIRQWW